MSEQFPLTFLDLTTATGVLDTAHGGTGSTSASGARTNLAVDIFQSPDQVITTAGSLTLAHGLGRTPQKVWFALVNQTTEGNYSPGDVVFSPSPASQPASNHGVSITVDGTNLNIRFGSNATTFELLNKTTGVSTSLTNSNWKIRFFCS